MNELRDYCRNLQKACTGGNDKDRVRVNFGGRHYDVMRKRLLEGLPGGWNLMSCLFMNRWERFLFRDKNDRIFFDYEFEWIKPLLCAIQGLPISLTEITGKEVTKQLCSDFLINNCSVFNTSAVDDFSSSIALPVLSSLRNEIQLAVNSADYYVTQLYSCDYRAENWLPWKPVPGTFSCILPRDLHGAIFVTFIKINSRSFSKSLLWKPLGEEVNEYIFSSDRVANVRNGLNGFFEIKVEIPINQFVRLEIYSIQGFDNKSSEKSSSLTTHS